MNTHVFLLSYIRFETLSPPRWYVYMVEGEIVAKMPLYDTKKFLGKKVDRKFGDDKNVFYLAFQI